MAMRQLSDKQWELIKDHVPRPPRQPKGGRPWADDRRCLEGILWIMSTGAQWAELPERYPGYATCWRRLKRWEAAGVFIRIWKVLLAILDAEGGIVWAEAFADGTFSPAKKGAQKSARQKKERAQRS